MKSYERNLRVFQLFLSMISICNLKSENIPENHFDGEESMKFETWTESDEVF